MERKRILIWGKTYPELSAKYFETVCSGGVFEETGQPVRIYPIPFRYLEGEGQFAKYQWISAEVEKSTADSRPESYRIDCDSIQLQEVLPTTADEWGKRADFTFRYAGWQFDSVEALWAEQAAKGTSIGVVIPKSIESVEVVTRPQNDQATFEQKFKNLQETLDARHRQMNLFSAETLPTQMKDLRYLTHRIRVGWSCFGSKCTGHEMQILDWEVAELHRKLGDAKAIEKVRDVLDLNKYATKFFLGNFFLHPTAFTIAGLWYPKRAEGRLFV